MTHKKILFRFETKTKQTKNSLKLGVYVGSTFENFSI